MNNSNFGIRSLTDEEVNLIGGADLTSGFIITVAEGAALGALIASPSGPGAAIGAAEGAFWGGVGFILNTLITAAVDHGRFPE